MVLPSTTADNIKITDNYISGSARNGASVTDSSGNTIENNTIENVGMNRE